MKNLHKGLDPSTPTKLVCTTYMFALFLSVCKFLFPQTYFKLPKARGHILLLQTSQCLTAYHKMNEIQKLQQIVKKKKRIEPFCFQVYFSIERNLYQKEKKHDKEKGFDGETWRHDKLFCSWLWQEQLRFLFDLCPVKEVCLI